MLRRITVVLLVLVTPVCALAQPLVDRVSEAAVVYVGWAGSEDLPGYEGSHAQALIENSDLPKIFSEFLPALANRVQRDDAEAADAFRIVSEIGQSFWRHPTAIVFYGVEVGATGEPMPRLQLLSQAGDEAEALADRINGLLADAGEMPMTVTARARQGLFIFSVGEVPEVGETTLAGSERFKSALAQVQRDAAFTMYVDGPALTRMIESVVEHADDPDVQQNWPRVREALAPEGIVSLTITGGFEDRMWTTRAFVAAPAPRKGLAAFLSGQPLGQDIFDAVPQTSTYAGIWSFDVGSAVRTLRETLQQISPETAQQMDQVLSMASAMVGTNVQTELLDALGPDWAVYTSPEVGGAGLLGMTIVNDARDPAKVQRSLDLIKVAANNMMAGQRRAPDDPRIAFRTTEHGGLKVNYLAVPIVAPGWALDDGNLYVGLYPQVVLSASRVTDAEDGRSIRDNERYAALRQRLGGENATAVEFYDLPELVGDSYGLLLLFNRIYLGMSDMFDVPAPPMMTPPLDVVRKHITPAMAVAWTSDDGMHYRSLTPFPGAAGLTMQGQFLAPQTVAVATAVLLPSLQRARESANRVKSASNLRFLGQVMHIYAAEHDGALPPNLDGLEMYGMVDQILDSPLGDAAEGSDYVYFHFDDLRVTSRGGNELIVAYDAAAWEQGDGTNALFLDGHVEWLTPDTFRDAVARSREHEPKSVPAELLGF